MTPVQLAQSVCRVLQQYPTVEVPFENLKKAGLGYPIVCHNGRVLEWWGQDALDVWCAANRVRVLPMHLPRGVAILTKA